MKFTCDTKELSKSCQIVARAVSTKSSVPLLGCIKFDAKDGHISLCGYNLEFGISTDIAVHGTVEEGTTLINAKTICAIVKTLPDGFTTIETQPNNIVTVKSGDAKFDICTMPAGEYPEIPNFNLQFTTNIKQKVLKDLIRQTIFAVADDNARPVYTGALFKIEEGRITTVGTDGYRLAKCHDTIDYHGKVFDFVVPKTTLADLSFLLSDEPSKTAAISVDSRHAIFEIGNYNIFTRLLEGEYMDYDKAIPSRYATEVQVDVQTVLESTERVSLVMNDKLRSPLKMAINHIHNRIEMSCATAFGTAKDALNANITGDELTIGFNSKYLADALKNVSCDEVRLRFNGPLSPMVVLPDSGDSFVFLVLPVRLKE